MSRIFANFALIFCTFGGAASSQVAEVTDISRYEIFDEGEIIVTLSNLQEMEDSYTSVLETDGCVSALPEIVMFSDAANLASNLIRRGVKPFYDARRDDQNKVMRNVALRNDILSAENTSNKLIHRRNRAWIEEAKCLFEVGDDQGAMTRLYRALDYIGTDEAELWEEARTLLWSKVGFAAGG